MGNYAHNDIRREWPYVIGEGPTSTIYDDAMWLAENGRVEELRGALRELFYRHLETKRALARSTRTEVEEMPLPESLGPPRMVHYQGSAGMAEDWGEPIQERVRVRRDRPPGRPT